MWPFVTDRVTWSVCWSVMIVSPAKTTESIEMPFGCGLGWAQGILYLMVSRSSHTKGQFRGEGTAHCKLQGHSVVSCAKMADPIEMPFVVWTWVGVSKHVSDGVHIGAT